jgi:hypothetical protein
VVNVGLTTMAIVIVAIVGGVIVVVDPGIT